MTARTNSTTVLKLGGSVITEKDSPETVDEQALRDAAAMIGKSVSAPSRDTPGGAVADPSRSDGLVIVHGGGSFGHHFAAEHGVSETDGTRDVGAIAEIHDAMGRLNRTVVTELHDAGVPAVPVTPFPASHRDEDGELHLGSESVGAMVDEGFVPVLHGDVVLQAGTGVTILSGDEIVVSLAESLPANRIGLCTTVPGVLDSEGEVIGEIRDFESVAELLGGSAETDVTGGMAEKVRKLLTLETSSSIFCLDDLDSFLTGETPGTTVTG
jgi:isopentenyl phosphate kinase